ncbi:MAG: hypothetical protein ACTHY4_08805, partial [Flavobacteriaceae bacterium]
MESLLGHKISAFFIVFTCVLFSTTSTSAQTQDSTETGYSFGEIFMGDPSSIAKKYEYDPILDKYIYTEKIGKVNIKYPLVLT